MKFDEVHIGLTERVATERICVLNWVVRRLKVDHVTLVLSGMFYVLPFRQGRGTVLEAEVKQEAMGCAWGCVDDCV